MGAAAAGFAGFGVGGDEWEFVLDGLGVDGGFLSFHDFDDLLDFRGGCCGCGFVEEVGDGFDDWGGGDDGGSGGERGEHGLDGCFATFFAVFLVFAFVLATGFGTGDGEFAAHEGLVVEDFDGAFGFIDVEHFDEPVAFGAVGCAIVDDLDAADGAYAFEEVFEVFFGDVVGEVADVDAGGFDGVRVAAAAVATRGAFATRFAVSAGFAIATAFASITVAPAFAVAWGAFFAGSGGVAFTIAVAEVAGVVFGSPDFQAFGAWWIDGAFGARGPDGFFVESDGFEQFLPPAELGGGVGAWWPGVLATVALSALSALALAAAVVAVAGVFGVVLVVVAVLVAVASAAVAAAFVISRIAGFVCCVRHGFAWVGVYGRPGAAGEGFARWCWKGPADGPAWEGRSAFWCRGVPARAEARGGSPVSSPAGLRRRPRVGRSDPFPGVGPWFSPRSGWVERWALGRMVTSEVGFLLGADATGWMGFGKA